MIELVKSCNHIYGFTEPWYEDADDGFGEHYDAKLCYDKKDVTGDIFSTGLIEPVKFTFCPLCGEKLE